MTQRTAELVELALALDVDERAELVSALLESIEASDAVAPEFAALLAQRDAEMEFGVEEGVSLEAFRAELVSAAGRGK